MAKRKKRRRRKKQAGRRSPKGDPRTQAKKSGRSEPSGPAPAKRGVWALVVVIVCAAIAGFWGVKSFLRSDEKTQKEEPGPILTGQPESSRVPSKLTPEEEFAKLKKEEMKLAWRVMKDFPDDDGSNVLMGNLYSRHGNSAEAIKFWERSLKINPKRADVYRKMGTLAQETGEPEKAITLWRKALEIKPDMAGIRNDVARVLIELGRYSEAIIELEEEGRISPVSRLTCFLFAQAYLQQNEYDKARQYYETTIKLKPDFTHAYYGLYRVCVKLEEWDKAQEYEAIFKKLKAQERNTYMGRDHDTFADLTSLKKGVAKTYLDAERLYRVKGDIQEEERLLQRASELEPTNAQCRERLASLYQMSNRIEDALTQFEKMREIQPQNPFCYLNIGILSSQLKRFNEASKAFQQAIALAPKQSFGYRHLARLYLRTNKGLAEARRLAEKAVELEAVAENYFILSWACDMNGDGASALAAIGQAIELEPDNPKYKQIYEIIKKKN